MTGPPPRADRVYLGWEYAELHPDPGPPPGRPAPPGPEQLSPGWLAAQQREERRLSRPLWLGGGSGLGLAGLTAALGLLGVLNAALTVAGLGCFMLLAGWCARGVWLGRRELRALVARGTAAGGPGPGGAGPAVAWLAAGARPPVTGLAGPRPPVPGPAAVVRGGAARGPRPGGRGGRHAGRLVGAADHAGRVPAGGRRRGHRARPGRGRGGPGPAAGRRRAGADPLVWVLPADLPRLDLGRGLPAAALADVLAVAAAAGGDPASPPDPSGVAQDTAILERVAGRARRPAQRRPSSRPACGCWPRSATRTRTSGPGCSARPRPSRSPGCTAGRRPAGSPSGRWPWRPSCASWPASGSAPVPLPPSRLRVVAVDAAAGLAEAQVLGALPDRGADPPAPRPAGARPGLAAHRAGQRGRDARAATCWTGCPTPARPAAPGWCWPTGRCRRTSGSGSAGATRRSRSCGWATPTTPGRPASRSAPSTGSWSAQLTDTVGSSVSDTAGQSYTSTVGTATPWPRCPVGQPEQRAERRARPELGRVVAPFAPRTASAHRDTS